MATDFDQVKAGMYFEKPFSAETPIIGSNLVIYKGPDSVTTFHVHQIQNEFLWYIQKWTPSAWGGTWMAKQDPIKPNYRLIVKNIWGQHL
jgi:hypothetical protein